MLTSRDVMEYDVVIVGAGPSGLASAIQLKQLATQQGINLSVCILEKGSEVGSHIISGCVMDPRALNELIPNWRDLNFPVTTAVTSDKTWFLTAKNKIALPLPKEWGNHGNYILSLSQLCRRLAEYAESLGVEIYPGFAAKAPIIENNYLKGIITGDMGLDRNGKPTANYQAGVEIRAKQTILAEGCRGSVSKQIIAHFQLDKNSAPQTYGLGIKEIWRVNPRKHIPGTVIHTLGYPLPNSVYGGGFIYHLDNNLVALGLVTALDYTNPYLSPYEEFQRFKTHPQIYSLLEDGERLEYGARTVVEGGIQSLPRLEFAGGVLVGDSAGFLNVPKVKGVHNAMKSGMLAASAVINAVRHQHSIANTYTILFKKSWLYRDLFAVRNIRPAFRYGRIIGMFYAAIEKYILKNKAPWTFKLKIADHQRLEHKSRFQAFTYPPYDNVVTFDKASSVHLANVTHDDSQPIHLKLNDRALSIKINLLYYHAPEARYCPAGVYEIVKQHGSPILQINSQNCVHCKACDIKDPQQNIRWTIPEAGSGPQYSDM
jgi:electron-transferring-flavoprotein dehydrogenase